MDQKWIGFAYGDLRQASLFRKSRGELATFDPRYRNAGNLDQLSELNLQRIREHNRKIDQRQAAAFLAAFRELDLYWKHATSNYRNYLAIIEHGVIVSATRLIEHTYSPAVIASYQGEGSYRTFLEDPDNPDRLSLQEFLKTSKFELDYRGDGGFVFFRMELGPEKVMDTGFGRFQFIFNPRVQERLEHDGWITLRDVYMPWSGDNLDSGSTFITCGNSQRITTYEPIDANLLRECIDSTTGIVPEANIGRIVDAGLNWGDYNKRRFFQHRFLNGRPGIPQRYEHVLEGAFRGTEAIREGLAHSALRAFWEIPDLWTESLRAAGNAAGFREFMQTWLHRFFHVEAKYPWEVSIALRKPVILARPVGLGGLRIYVPTDFRAPAEEGNEPLTFAAGGQVEFASDAIVDVAAVLNAIRL